MSARMMPQGTSIDDNCIDIELVARKSILSHRFEDRCSPIGMNDSAEFSCLPRSGGLFVAESFRLLHDMSARVYSSVAI